MEIKVTFIKLFAVLLALQLASPAALSAERRNAEELVDIEKDILAEGDYTAALERLRPVLDLETEDPRALLARGIALYGLMEYDKSLAALEAAREAGPGREEEDLVQYAIANIEENRATLGRVEEMNSSLAAAAEGEKEAVIEGMAVLHLAMVRRLMDEKYYYPFIVMPHIIWLKENIPDIKGIYRLSGDVYYAAMYYSKAVEEYEKAAEEDPEDPALYRTMGDCSVAMGDFEGAEESYQSAAELYRKRGGKEDIRRVMRIEALIRTLPRRYSDISDLIESERYFEAEEICRKRLSLNPADLAALTQLGEIRWRQGKKREAIKLWRRARKTVPDYPVSYFYLGRAYFTERKPEKADRQFDIFMEKMDDLPETGEDTKEFYAGALNYISYCYFSRKEYEKSMDICRKVLEIDPDNQRAHYNMGVIYYNHYLNRSRAYSEMKKVIDIDSHTLVAERARFFIDYLRRNPDARIIGDFGFMEEE